MIDLTDQEMNQLQVKKKVISRQAKPATIKKPKAITDIDKLITAIGTLIVNPTQQDIAPIMEAMIRIQQTQNELLAKLQETKPAKAKNYEFNIVRSRAGTIDKIIAKETS